jgi:hypothetical protein
VKSAALAALVAVASCSRWSAPNYAGEGAFVALLAVDWGQTKKITRDCVESNPILGRCGHRVPVDVWMPLAALLHLAVSLALPPRALDWWQGVTGGAEAAAVWINLRGGYLP